MSHIKSFPPIANPQATILILGSMPGIASLNAQQYYAHPRNGFWPIMADTYKFDLALPYAVRVNALQKTNVAVWDVLKHCDRIGSLDSAIIQDSVEINDFATFFNTHPHIKTLAFNGAVAEKQFVRNKSKLLEIQDKQFVRLPSTSPAHTMPLNEKRAIWQTALFNQ